MSTRRGEIPGTCLPPLSASGRLPTPVHSPTRCCPNPGAELRDLHPDRFTHRLDHVHHPFEPARIAVMRIRHATRRHAAAQVGGAAQLLGVLWRTDVAHPVVVARVHRDHPIKALEAAPPEVTCAQAAKRIAAALRARLRTSGDASTHPPGIASGLQSTGRRHSIIQSQPFYSVAT